MPASSSTPSSDARGRWPACSVARGGVAAVTAGRRGPPSRAPGPWSGRTAGCRPSRTRRGAPARARQAPPIWVTSCPPSVSSVTVSVVVTGRLDHGHERGQQLVRGGPVDAPGPHLRLDVAGRRVGAGYREVGERLAEAREHRVERIALLAEVRAVLALAEEGHAAERLGEERLEGGIGVTPGRFGGCRRRGRRGRRDGGGRRRRGRGRGRGRRGVPARGACERHHEERGDLQSSHVRLSLLLRPRAAGREPASAVAGAQGAALRAGAQLGRTRGTVDDCARNRLAPFGARPVTPGAGGCAANVPARGPGRSCSRRAGGSRRRPRGGRRRRGCDR